MISTTDKGNAFRDVVDQVLSAAGFRTDPEARVHFKKVDNRAVYIRDEMNGVVRYLFETKDYEGALPKEACIHFAEEYGTLVDNGEADYAWLVSKGPISPDGKAFVEKRRGLQCLTFVQLQRRLLQLDGYLRTLMDERNAMRLAEYYVEPETPEGVSLEGLVQEWVEAADGPPLFVLATYGKGKSTFATHLAAKMAAAAMDDATLRVPVLVRLGEIVDEQSLDGLLGKVLASQYRIPNYHFDAFMELNRLGRFLVIYDGFDEMKHGMTFARFQHVLNELMRLDQGKARILVLGRPTALHDEQEFKAVIDGRQITAAGREVPANDRREYRKVEIRGFTITEAHDYVKRYFPIRVARISKQSNVADEAWVQQRIDHLVSGRFDELLERPVHAQMLCDIAAHPEYELENLTVYELFDTFVHYLLDRETKKKGRDPNFDLQLRRAFNGMLAWWLWERGGAGATTLGDIPEALCKEVARDVKHSHGEVGLRRELIQGCLVEKAADTIYFGHRSLQEFLVADHLIASDLLADDGGEVSGLERALKSITPEVISFIVAGVQTTPERREKALHWFERLPSLRGNSIPVTGFMLFPKLARAFDMSIEDPALSPWLLWAHFLQAAEMENFTQLRRGTFSVLTEVLWSTQRRTEESQAAALYAFAKTLRSPSQIRPLLGL
jgi:hypothetical protein